MTDYAYKPFFFPTTFLVLKDIFVNLTEIGFLRGTSQKHLAGIYIRQLLPVSFHAMLMQLLFCSAPSVIFRISFEFLLRSIEVLIFLIEFVFSALWSEFFFALLVGEEFQLVLNVLCLFEFFFSFKIFSISFPKCSKSLFIDIVVYFPALILPHFLLFLQAFDFLLMSLCGLQVIGVYTTRVSSDLRHLERNIKMNPSNLNI